MLKSKKKREPKKTPWKTPLKGIPRWVKAIPESKAHGSGTLQKRLWRLTSDFVRIRDFYRYKGVCVASGVSIPEWKSGQAGHYISYSVCNGMFKWDTRNIHFQSAISNKLSTRESWQQYEATLIQRYGVQYLSEIEEGNKTAHPKFTNEQLIERMKELLIDMLHLPEQPEYHTWVTELLGCE